MNMNLSDFSTTINLLTPYTVNDSPHYLEVATLALDPRLLLEEELNLELEIWGKSYKLIAKICKIQKHIVSGESSKKFVVRYFVESENRKEVIEIWESIKKHNPII
jgi:hypothetical protein